MSTRALFVLSVVVGALAEPAGLVGLVLAMAIMVTVALCWGETE